MHRDNDDHFGINSIRDHRLTGYSHTTAHAVNRPSSDGMCNPLAYQALDSRLKVITNNKHMR